MLISRETLSCDSCIETHGIETYARSLLTFCIYTFAMYGTATAHTAIESVKILTTSVLLAQVRKPPDISQTHAVSDNTEKELHFAAPCRSVLFFRLWWVVNDILISCHDRYALAGLAVVVQGSQLVPISRGLGPDYHPLGTLNRYTRNRSPCWPVERNREILNTPFGSVCGGCTRDDLTCRFSSFTSLGSGDFLSDARAPVDSLFSHLSFPSILPNYSIQFGGNTCMYISASSSHWYITTTTTTNT